MQDIKKINEAINFLRKRIDVAPKIGLVLGSGLNILAEEIKNPIVIPYNEIPHFPLPTVDGHKGQLVLGEIEGKAVICMQGRFHYYEGYTLQQITFPIRVMQKLGVSQLLVTNAAGGVNEQFTPGDLMIITDHINLIGANPLRGSNMVAFGDRFPDMSQAYKKRLREIAIKAGDELGIKVQQGVYAGVAGPSYETPAEVRCLRAIGADAVGMSTVPEVIVANHGGIDVLGISCITNMAAGILDQPLDHDEVVQIASRVKGIFIKFVKKILKTI